MERRTRSYTKLTMPYLFRSGYLTFVFSQLTRRQLTAEDLAVIIDKRHRLRQKAKESHARRAQVALE